MKKGTRAPAAVGVSQSRTVLAAGYLALDAVLYQGRATLRAGGTAGNVASNLAFFGWGANVVGRVGADHLGTALQEDLSKAGVATKHLESSDTASTPVVFHHVSSSGPKYTFRCPACGRKLGRHSPPTSEAISGLLDLMRPPSVFFFDRVSKGTLELAESAREQGSLVVFEPSTLGLAHLFNAAVRLAHIVKYSSERAAAVEGALPRRPAGQVRIVTRGSDGLEVSSRRGWRSVRTYETAVIDAAGAGDWTTAALLYGLPSVDPNDLDDEAVWSTLHFAQAVAAMSCSFVGARGMALGWDQNCVLQNARKLTAGETRTYSGEAAAGDWFSKDELIAQLCNPTCPA
jgi:fructokinase